MYAIRSYYGDLGPEDPLLELLTQLPSPWAIGATWDVDLSRMAGTIKGQELSALGFNLLVITSYSIHYTKLYDSLARKRADGPWALGHRGTLAALARADALIALNPADVPALAGYGEVEILRNNFV